MTPHIVVRVGDAPEHPRPGHARDGRPPTTLRVGRARGERRVPSFDEEAARTAGGSPCCLPLAPRRTVHPRGRREDSESKRWHRTLRVKPSPRAWSASPDSRAPARPGHGRTSRRALLAKISDSRRRRSSTARTRRFADRRAHSTRGGIERTVVRDRIDDWTARGCPRHRRSRHERRHPVLPGGIGEPNSLTNGIDTSTPIPAAAACPSRSFRRRWRACATDLRRRRERVRRARPLGLSARSECDVVAAPAP